MLYGLGRGQRPTLGPALVANIMHSVGSVACYLALCDCRPTAPATPGGVIELAAEDASTRADGSHARRAATPKTALSAHPAVRHWVPWLLPLLAIVLPLGCFALAASVDDSAWTWGAAGTSVRRGDLLIPALIVCAEAWRRWWIEVKGRKVVLTFAVLFTLLCGAAVIMCLVAFSGAANSNSVAEHGSKIVVEVTWTSFIAGLLAGTIAVILTRSPEGRN